MILAEITTAEGYQINTVILSLLRATFGPKRNETSQVYVKAVSEQSIKNTFKRSYTQPNKSCFVCRFTGRLTVYREVRSSISQRYLELV